MQYAMAKLSQLGFALALALAAGCAGRAPEVSETPSTPTKYQIRLFAERIRQRDQREARARRVARLLKEAYEAVRKDGHHPTALLLLDYALKIDPDHRQALAAKAFLEHWVRDQVNYAIQRTEVLMAEQRYKEAMDEANRGLQHDPNNEELRRLWRQIIDESSGPARFIPPSKPRRRPHPIPI